ncbi:hypothetical protein HD806DRAFT_521911 [Xylariaceae sp. AK1471]|nr:hypothetical protein HD806DRAFT_521911 [Xylariaceae sp. AK1471]
MEETYRNFIECLKEHRWGDSGAFLHSSYAKNDKPFSGDSFAAELQEHGRTKLHLDAVTIDEKGQRLASSILVKWEPSVRVMGFDPPPKHLLYIEHHVNWFVDGKLFKTTTMPNRAAVHAQLSDPDVAQTPDIMSNAEAGQGAATAEDMEELYRRYIASINARTMGDDFGSYMYPNIIFNGAAWTVDDLRSMLEPAFAAVPDCVTVIKTMIADEKAQRLAVQLTASGTMTKPLFGLDAVGKPVRFAEHNTYQFRDGKMARFWSLTNWGNLGQTLLD